MSVWTQAEAIELCRKIEAVCTPFGCHVALTGGLLYKSGTRKDADILFYRHRRSPEIDVEGLMGALVELGVELRGDELTLFVQKGKYNEKPIDFFFPEATGYYGTDGTEGAPVNPSADPIKAVEFDWGL